MTARLLPWHVALVVSLVACALLGQWQLDHFRHHDRSRAGAPVTALDDVTLPGGRVASDDIGRRVTVTGTYDAARTLLVPRRERDGRTGFWVVTPLRTTTGVLPVVRGWVARRSAAGATAPADDVRLTGRLQQSEGSGTAGVDPLQPLPDDETAYVATVNLVAVWPYSPKELYDGFVMASVEIPAPSASPARVDALLQSGGIARWRNLVYAINWWVFGVLSLLFWGAVVRRDRRERRDPEVSAPRGR